MSQRSATLTVLRRISGPVTPPLKQLADRRLFRRSKISLPLSSHYTTTRSGALSLISESSPGCSFLAEVEMSLRAGHVEYLWDVSSAAGTSQRYPPSDPAVTN
ncbi:hypothetical protein CROQUDRAFT_99104 [Cronartium quercuum f. sp. fusiforme G11]|uniref:Uncharacterized protein n=1 Tax=Cronartium quercuum f. sp. fusiforme G11 TaxID=708437 RepID=A0A9P6NBI9_9BASI|nr:hypothetical protein CROQUDRAFT_99104 [Cronartium quercuum f. sp. fusiforme G11]